VIRSQITSSNQSRARINQELANRRRRKKEGDVMEVFFVQRLSIASQIHRGPIVRLTFSHAKPSIVLVEKSDSSSPLHPRYSLLRNLIKDKLRVV
jgi:hypothetical protein